MWRGAFDAPTGHVLVGVPTTHGGRPDPALDWGMTKSEYHELIEFLGEKFGQIDRRFEAIDQRFEALETRQTRSEIVQESMRDDIRGIADVLMTLNHRFDRLETEMRDGFERLDHRMVRTERRLSLIEAHGGRIDKRLDLIEAHGRSVDNRLDLIESHGRSVDGHLESIESRLAVA